MKREDLNRALVKCESFSEALLLNIIALPKPFTAVVTAVTLALAAYGAYILLS